MPGLIGFRGQGMATRKVIIPTLVGKVSTSRVGSLTLTEDLLADIFAWAGGASGNAPGAGTPYGGGGGSAGYSRLILPRGTLLAWAPGAGGTSTNNTSGVAGSDTTVSINGVVHGTCQGGRASNGSVAAARSTSTGFQVNRYGGGSNETGEQGTAPVWLGTGSRVGGGAGGFNDLFAGTTGEGTTTNSNSGGSTPLTAQPGAGGDASVDTSYSVYGGYGRVEISLYRLT